MRTACDGGTGWGHCASLWLRHEGGLDRNYTWLRNRCHRPSETCSRRSWRGKAPTVCPFLHETVSKVSVPLIHSNVSFEAHQSESLRDAGFVAHPAQSAPAAVCAIECAAIGAASHESRLSGR
jgi:hypothetical protein